MKDKKRKATSNEQRAMSKEEKDRKKKACPELDSGIKNKQQKQFSFIQRPEPIFERLKVPSNVIYLVKREDRWYTISDFPDKILAMLGTNELATPYAASARAEVVYKYVQQTNLDKFVMVMV